MSDHFRSPAHSADEWNDPTRDQWQKPEEILSALALETGMTAVDVGSGTGYLLPRLAAAVGDTGAVIALDVSDEMLAYLAQKIASEGLRAVRAQRARHDDPMLAPHSVDRIVVLNTWHHVEERPRYAEKLLAALRPGGRLAIVDFLPEPTEGFGPPLELRLGAEQVAEELRAGGFRASVATESLPRHYIVVGVAPE